MTPPRYQGILGSCVGLGNTIGPFVAGAFIDSTSWRYLFYLIAGLSVLAGLVILLILPPSKMPKEDLRTKLNKIDYLGIVTSSITIVLLLIPISGIGSYFSARSPMVISMLALGGLAAILFFFTEWKIAKLPMMPCKSCSYTRGSFTNTAPVRMFKTKALTAILLQNILMGITFYGIMYYMPIYYQTIRQFSAVKAAALIVPLVATQAIASSASGYYISSKGRYSEVIWLGYTLWTIAAVVQCSFTRKTPSFGIALTLIVEGIGVGCIFQPSKWSQTQE